MATTDIQGVTTATTAFVAPAPKGPLNVAVGVTSVAGFAGRFGKAAINTPLGEAVSLFFANGGRKAFVVRVPAGSPPTVADYGDPAADTGIYSLDRVKILNLLCPVSDDTALFDLYPSAAAYCEQRRSMLLVGLPLNASMADAQNWMRFPGATIHSRNVAAYYPSLLVSDGSGAVSRPVSCVGAVAGVFARTDSTRGVWRAATGSEANIAGVVGLAGRLTAQQVSALGATGLNCLRMFPGTGPTIWGDRTMAGAEDSSAEDKYIPVRRLGLFIEQSVQNGTRWAASRRNGPALWGRITAAVTAFLHSLFTEGAFPGARPDQSFFVRCDSTTMTQADQDAGIVNIVVGFAPLRPAEFTIISIRQLLHPP